MDCLRREWLEVRFQCRAICGLIVHAALGAMPALLHDPEGRRQDDAARSEAVQKLAGITASSASTRYVFMENRNGADALAEERRVYLGASRAVTVPKASSRRPEGSFTG